MSQAPDASETNSLRQWVLGLAVAIFCCAIVFHFVARFFADTQEKIAVTQLKLEFLESRLNRLESDAAARPLQLPAVATTPMPAAVAPAPQAKTSVTPTLTLPQLVAPPVTAPETKSEKAPAATEKSEADNKPADKIVIVPSTELLLNTRTEVPDVNVTPAGKGKTDKQTDKAKAKTKADEE